MGPIAVVTHNAWRCMRRRTFELNLKDFDRDFRGNTKAFPYLPREMMPPSYLATARRTASSRIGESWRRPRSTDAFLRNRLHVSSNPEISSSPTSSLKMPSTHRAAPPSWRWTKPTTRSRNQVPRQKKYNASPIRTGRLGPSMSTCGSSVRPSRT